MVRHMGPEHASREKILSMVKNFIFVHNNAYRIRFQGIKIGILEGFENIEFVSLFLMRKRLSGGQRWFLKPYFPLIRGMFVFKSGLRFSFRALEVPEPRVRKRPFSLTKMTFSLLSVASSFLICVIVIHIGCPRKKFQIEILEVWQLWTLSGHFGLFWTFFGTFGHSADIWELLGTLGTIGHFWSFWELLGTFRHFGPFWALWALLGTFGRSRHFYTLWALLGNFGHSEHFMALLSKSAQKC